VPTRTRAQEQATDEGYLSARLGKILAGQQRLDEGLRRRAESLGIRATEEAVRAHEERVLSEAGDAGGRPINDLEARLGASGVARGLLRESITRHAWRCAVGEAIVRAGRPEAAAEAVRAAFEERYGPEGVSRTYRQVVFSTDPASSRLEAGAGGVEDRAAVRAAAERSAKACLERIRADPVAWREDVALRRSRVDVEAASADATIAPRLAVARPGEADLVESTDAYWVLRILSRVPSCRVEAVRLAVLPRPGETAVRMRERAARAALELAQAPDPAMYSLENSDDPEDRRHGGVLEATIGVDADGSSPARRATEAPSEVLDELAQVAVGAVTRPVAWRGGFMLARLTARRAIPGRDRTDALLFRFPFDEAAVRAHRLAGGIERLAEERARRILAIVAGGGDMAALARAESEDAATREAGGVFVGGLDEGRVGAAFTGAVASLPPGGEARILRSPLGFHVIRCEREVRTQLPAVEAALRATIRARPASPRELEALFAALRDGG